MSRPSTESTDSALTQGERSSAEFEADSIPDLLHPVSIRRVDEARTKLALLLAFSGGASGGLFTQALELARVTPSSWQPVAFVDGLFLKQFVTLCFSTSTEHKPAVAVQHLVNLLAHPPSDVEIIHYRRKITVELAASSELRRALEQVYAALCRLRTLLEGMTEAAQWGIYQRRLDILQLIKEIVDILASRFGAACSGLAKLHTFGMRVQQGEPYRLLADLLQYEEHRATLNVKIGVGADGRIRRFELVSVHENKANRFVSSLWRRWLAKLELLVRGFKFGDGELMARLLDAVFEEVQPELVAFIQLLGDIEFYLGTLTFRDRVSAAGLSVCLPEFCAEHEPRQLLGLFNPLLLALGTPPVPCDITTDRHDTTVLITGPNSGGKTRLLQALGLSQLLAQAGVFVPARSAQVALAKGLVVSLIEETKIDHIEGRLGAELQRIRTLFERLPLGAMVLMDELCSGTNPSEGEELFELVVRMLVHLKPQAFITTHFLSFAARLEQEAKIANLRFLQVALGKDQLPTYQFLPGVARSSLAAQVAQRLGVTGEQLMQLIEMRLKSPEQTRAASKNPDRLSGGISGR